MKKAVIVTSGGIDSITNGLMMLKGHISLPSENNTSDYQYGTIDKCECVFLHLNYRQKCEVGEKLSCIKIVQVLKQMGCSVDLKLVDVPFFTEVGRGSSLVDESVKVHSGMESIDLSSGEIGDIWVPARNVVFLAIGAAYAEKIGAEYITLGCNQSEIGFPDNTKEFLDRFTNMLEMGTIQCHPKVISPEWYWDKSQILKWGYDNGFREIYKYTWSSDDKTYKITMDDRLPSDRIEVVTKGDDGCSMNRRMAYYILQLQYGDKYPDEQRYIEGSYFESVFLKEVKERLDDKRYWWYKYKDLIMKGM